MEASLSDAAFVAFSCRRWIRLLFGREFCIDDLLVLWDALFADGPLLDLVDYVYIAMLESIREKRKVLMFPIDPFSCHTEVPSVLSVRGRSFLESPDVG